MTSASKWLRAWRDWEIFGVPFGSCNTDLTSALVVATDDACIADQPLVHYIIVRGDLPKGLQVAQTVHAAGESVKGPVPSGTISVALELPDAPSLVMWSHLLTNHGIEHVLIRESNDEPMAIGCAPTRDRAQMRKVLGALPLVK